MYSVKVSSPLPLSHSVDTFMAAAAAVAAKLPLASDSSNGAFERISHSPS